MKAISLSGINFYKGSYLHCLSEIQCRATDKITTLIVTPNPEMLYEAERDTALKDILTQADFALPDGAGIFVAHQITHSRLPRVLKYLVFPYWCVRAIIHGNGVKRRYGERITGARLTRDLLQFAHEKHIIVTIIDPVVQGNKLSDRAKRLSQESMERRIMEKFSDLQLNIIISDIVPDDLPLHGIIFATHGGGKQEKLLADLIKNGYSGLALGVGGSIDLITGFRSPAPAFFQRFGGEWLYRFYKNPTRHLKRMKKVLSFLRDCLNK